MNKFGFNRSIATGEPTYAHVIGQAMQMLKSGQGKRVHHPAKDESAVNLPHSAANMSDGSLHMEQLEKSAREKDILLSELQHRVKNDLNIILSLINLEMDKIHDEGLQQIMIDLKARISTITSTYRQLSFSNNTGFVDLRSHIRNIAESLFSTYSSHSWNLVIKTDLKEMKVDYKNATLLGLMINELATNAIKYALKNAEKGEIRIQMEKSDDTITVCVSDNGPGMPHGFDPENAGSMGLKLVMMLARQIGGTINIDRAMGGGTSVAVVFPYRMEIR